MLVLPMSMASSMLILGILRSCELANLSLEP
jgi:hypothetical protein